jgi:hypothetical protein
MITLCSDSENSLFSNKLFLRAIFTGYGLKFALPNARSRPRFDRSVRSCPNDLQRCAMDEQNGVSKNPPIIFSKGSPNMNLDQQRLVRASFEKVVPIGATTASLLYDRLFELDPKLRALLR